MTRTWAGPRTLRQAAPQCRPLSWPAEGWWNCSWPSSVTLPGISKINYQTNIILQKKLNSIHRKGKVHTRCNRSIFTRTTDYTGLLKKGHPTKSLQFVSEKMSRRGGIEDSLKRGIPKWVNQEEGWMSFPNYALNLNIWTPFYLKSKV